MPRVLLTHLTPPLFSAFVYTPDQGVGRIGPNDRADVLLVQFMLRIATSGNVNWSRYTTVPAAPSSFGRMTTIGRQPPSPNLPGPPPGAGQIVIDGVCGPQTIAFIEAFQQEMVRRG